MLSKRERKDESVTQTFTLARPDALFLTISKLNEVRPNDNPSKMIPVQVPAIETCFMSIDEIARFFSSPRAYIEGESSEFFPSPRA